MADTRAPVVFNATAWPEADRLFRSDPTWLGSDDAYSVPLGGDRTLWLFGDTFVDGSDRREARFVRNSVGIQAGADPTTASITFHHGRAPDGSFFEAPPGVWYWPLDGVRIGDGALVFMMQVRSPVGRDGSIDEWRDLGPLGFFDVFGWAALLIDNVDDDPARWRIARVAERSEPIVLGASVLVDGDHVLAYGWDPQKRISIARWRIHDIGALPEPEWWTGEEWARDGAPAVVIDDGATEFTVRRSGEGLVQIQVLPRTQSLIVRTAASPQGPWSRPHSVFRPEEAARDEVFVYAGKAHPQLTGADLVCTYASNSDADTCLDDPSIYYPRFVRLERARP